MCCTTWTPMAFIIKVVSFQAGVQDLFKPSEILYLLLIKLSSVEKRRFIVMDIEGDKGTTTSKGNRGKTLAFGPIAKDKLYLPPRKLTSGGKVLNRSKI